MTDQELSPAERYRAAKVRRQSPALDDFAALLPDSPAPESDDLLFRAVAALGVGAVFIGAAWWADRARAQREAKS